MMNKKFFQYKTVLKKELVDAFRDKKSIFATFILPIILFPLLFLFIGSGASDITTKSLSPTISVFLDNAEYTSIDMNSNDELSSFIKNDLFSFSSSMGVKITYLNSQNLVQDIIDANTTLALLVPEDLISLIQNNGTANIKLIYDDRSNLSTASASVVQSVINLYGQAINENRVQEVAPDLNTNSTQTISSSLSIAFPDVERAGTNNSFLQLLLPMLLTMLISVGGINIAVDLVAGEKERNTFEALLSTSASRFSILSAKYTVVIIFSIITAISEILAILISFIFGEKSAIFSAMSQVSLPLDATILVILNIFAMCALLSSVLLILTSTANTMKEANAKTLFVILIPLLISYSTIYMEVANVSFATTLIPIYNVTISIKMLLAGVMNYGYLFGSLIMNLAYAGLSILFTLKSFGKESILAK